MSRRIVSVLLVAFFMFAVLGFASAQTKVDKRVATTLKNIGYKYTVSKTNNYNCVRDLDDDRTQQVTIGSAIETYGDDDVEIREIWSLVGYFPELPDSDTMESLLLESAKKKIGAWCLEAQDDGRYLLYFSVKYPVSASDTDVKMIVDFVAVAADMRENELFDGVDEW